ncbi:MAG: serpin family protein [Congregibacter sp.]
MLKNLATWSLASWLAVSAPLSLGSESIDLQEASRVNRWSSDLLQVTLGEDGLRNTMISSVSMFYALSVLEAGALEESKELLRELLLTDPSSGKPLGDIATPLADALIFAPDDPESPSARFSLHNAAWSSNDRAGGKPFVFAQPFVELVAEAFDAQAYDLDFKATGASQAINDWAEESTEGLIKKVIDDKTLRDFTWLITNAAYFEGSWALPMRRVKSGSGFKFTTADGDAMEPTIVRAEQLLRVVDHEDGSVTLSIPFRGGKYAMVLQLAPAQIAEISGWVRDVAIPRQSLVINRVFDVDAPRVNARLRMPTFSFSDQLKMEANSPATEQLGLSLLFSQDADFMAMVDAERTHPAALHTKVGLIQQDTRIELDEKGVKAAAVTVIGGMIKSTVARRPVEYRPIDADRPFVWSIVESASRTALFSGVLATP